MNCLVYVPSMIRASVLIAALGACAGKPSQPAARPPSPPAGEAAAPAPPPPPAEAPPSLTGNSPALAEPAPATPAPAAPPPLYPRLRDAEGPVPGLAGYVLARSQDEHHCGGTKIVTSHGKGKVATDDQPLVDVYELAFPTGLDFSEAGKQHSALRFKVWMKQMQDVGAKATEHYEAQLHDRDARVQLAAAARLAQIRFRIASVIARAEIPADVATGDYAKDKIDAYCDALATAAEPLQASAEDAAKACAEKAAQLAVHGWWDQVCTP